MQLAAAAERFAEVTDNPSDALALLAAKDAFYDVLVAGAHTPVSQPAAAAALYELHIRDAGENAIRTLRELTVDEAV